MSSVVKLATDQLLLRQLSKLWRVKRTLRFLCKMFAYDTCFFVSAVVGTLLAMRRPGDPHNMEYYFKLLNYLTKWLNIRWEVRGAINLKSETPVVVMANHQSGIECPGMGRVWPSRCVMVAKKALQYWPGVNLAAWLASAVLIDRFNKSRARQALDAVVEQIRRKNVNLWIFPEGTRHNRAGMLPFKKGGFHVAVQAQIPIIPIVFSSVLPFYSVDESRFEDDGYVIIQVLPQVSTVGLSADDVDSLIERTRTQMVEKYEEITEEAERRYAWRDF